MTEQEWLACTDPRLMLAFLRGKIGDSFNLLFDKTVPIGTLQRPRAVVSERKIHLFASGCVRRVWKRLADPSRKALEVSEKYADRLVGQAALVVALENARKFREAIPLFDEPSYLHYLGEVDNIAYWRCLRPLEEAAAELVLGLGRDLDPETIGKKAADVAGGLARADAWEIGLIPEEGGRINFPARDAQGETAFRLRQVEELHAQSALLRDLFGNPFRPVTLDRRWQTPTVVKLAKMIYNRRKFDQMPQLATALEEAGCEEPDIRQHSLKDREHFRGCWVLDLVLGKA